MRSLLRRHSSTGQLHRLRRRTKTTRRLGCTSKVLEQHRRSAADAAVVNAPNVRPCSYQQRSQQRHLGQHHSRSRGQSWLCGEKRCTTVLA